MAQADAFLAEICERPDDDGPRLLYADWLEENLGTADHPGPGWPPSLDGQGQIMGSARAEFIRVQCALARAEGDANLTAQHRAALESRERELLAGQQTFWVEQLRSHGIFPAVNLVRGFPERVQISAANLIEHGGELLQAAPIREVMVFDVADINALVASPHLARVNCLELWNNGIGDEGAQALAASPHLAGLTSLVLGHNGIGDEGAAALAVSPHLARLNCLELWNNAIGDEGAQALAASPHLAGLTSLDLGNNGIGDEGAAALAASPHLARLNCLELWNNGIGDEGAQALAASPHLAGLTSLELGNNGIGDEGAQALAGTPHLGNLTRLGLRENGIGQEGGRALANSMHLGRLTNLDVENNAIGPAVEGEINRTIEARRQRRQGQGSGGPPP